MKYGWALVIAAKGIMILTFTIFFLTTKVFAMEQMLHAKYLSDKLEPAHKFGGHTECFKITSKILEDFPKKW